MSAADIGAALTRYITPRPGDIEYEQTILLGRPSDLVKSDAGERDMLAARLLRRYGPGAILGWPGRGRLRLIEVGSEDWEKHLWSQICYAGSTTEIYHEELDFADVDDPLIIGRPKDTELPAGWVRRTYGPDDVFEADEMIGPLAESTNGDCVVQALYKRWPVLKTREFAYERFRRPLRVTDLINLTSQLSKSSKAGGRNNKTGIRLVDRAGSVWWAFNDHLESKHVLTIQVDGNHGRLPADATTRPTKVRVVDDADLTAVVSASRSISAATWLDPRGPNGPKNPLVRISAVVSEEDPDTVMVSREKIEFAVSQYEILIGEEPNAHLADLLPAEKLRELLERDVTYAWCSGAESILWKQWRSSQPSQGWCGEGAHLYELLRQAQIEPGVYSAAGHDGEEVEAFDVNNAYTAYDYTPMGCPIHYDDYGFPTLPQVVLEAEPHQKDTILSRTGFATVKNVKIHHWSLSTLGYLNEGVTYPTPWLAYVKARGLADFDIPAWMPTGRFEMARRGPRRLFRSMVGKLIQKEIPNPPLWCSRIEERHRLIVGLLGSITRVEAATVNGITGWWVHTHRPNPKRYPHVRAYVLAFNHIKVFEGLRVCEKQDVLKVKTDSIAVKRDSASYSRLLSAITVSETVKVPGEWKRETAKIVREQTPRSRDVVELPPVCPSRLASGELQAEVMLKTPRSRTADEGWHTAGHAHVVNTERGSHVYTREVGGDASVGTPLKIVVDGAAGFGKTWYVSRILQYASRVVVLANGYRQIANAIAEVDKARPLAEDSKEYRLPLALSALRKLRKREYKGAPWERYGASPQVLWVEEAMTLCKWTLQWIEEAAAELGIGTILFSGDAQQLAPLCLCSERCPTNHRILSDITIAMRKDMRSADPETRALKREIRGLRSAGYLEVEQLALIRAAAKEVSLEEAVELAVREKGVVVCPTLRQTAAVNCMAEKLLLAEHGVDVLWHIDAPLPSRCTKVHTSPDGERIGQGTFELRTPRTYGDHWQLAYGTTCDVLQGSTIGDVPVIVYVEDTLDRSGFAYTSGTRHAAKGQLYWVTCPNLDIALAAAASAADDSDDYIDPDW